MQREALRRCSDTTLARVAWWPTQDPDGWRGLLRDLNIVDLGASLVADRMADLEALWASGFFTFREIAAAHGVTESSVRMYFRKHLRARRWETSMVGPHQKAYRLVA